VGLPQRDTAKRIFSDIAKLRVGKALLFSPSAIVGLEKGPEGVTVMERLGTDYLKIRVRKRLTFSSSSAFSYTLGKPN
jgi:hypothetical protein